MVAPFTRQYVGKAKQSFIASARQLLEPAFMGTQIQASISDGATALVDLYTDFPAAVLRALARTAVHLLPVCTACTLAPRGSSACIFKTAVTFAVSM